MTHCFKNIENAPSEILSYMSEPAENKELNLWTVQLKVVTFIDYSFLKGMQQKKIMQCFSFC